jgi:dTDP-4-dehydrorhamnose 3,5-epimerase-like enzyme
MVGAGAVVTRSVPPRAVVVGNPARIVGYADTVRRGRAEQAPLPADTAAIASGVRGVTIHRLKVVHDLRGDLSVGNFGAEVPFTPRRYFLVFDVPSKDVRGEHAHRRCRQFLVCVKGSVAVIVDDGTASEEIVLDEPGLGVYLPPMVWSVQYRYSPDAVLLVFASDPYDPDDYIRDYRLFLDLVRGAGAPHAAG